MDRERSQSSEYVELQQRDVYSRKQATFRSNMAKVRNEKIKEDSQQNYCDKRNEKHQHQVGIHRMW